jgi:hypothetical protein
MFEDWDIVLRMVIGSNKGQGYELTATTEIEAHNQSSELTYGLNVRISKENVAVLFWIPLEPLT